MQSGHDQEPWPLGPDSSPIPAGADEHHVEDLDAVVDRTAGRLRHLATVLQILAYVALFAIGEHYPVFWHWSSEYLRPT